MASEETSAYTTRGRTARHRGSYNSGVRAEVLFRASICRARADGFYENRAQEITEITNSLKALAKELSVPILALSQRTT